MADVLALSAPVVVLLLFGLVMRRLSLRLPATGGVTADPIASPAPLATSPHGAQPVDTEVEVVAAHRRVA